MICFFQQLLYLLRCIELIRSDTFQVPGSLATNRIRGYVLVLDAAASNQMIRIRVVMGESSYGQEALTPHFVNLTTQPIQEKLVSHGTRNLT